MEIKELRNLVNIKEIILDELSKEDQYFYKTKTKMKTAIVTGIISALALILLIISSVKNISIFGNWTTGLSLFIGLCLIISVLVIITLYQNKSSRMIYYSKLEQQKDNPDKSALDLLISIHPFNQILKLYKLLQEKEISQIRFNEPDILSVYYYNKNEKYPQQISFLKREFEVRYNDYYDESIVELTNNRIIVKIKRKNDTEKVKIVTL